MKLSNKTYDMIKYITTTLIPLLVILITTLSAIFGFEEWAKKAAEVLAAFSVFFGGLVGISSDSYKYEDTDKNYVLQPTGVDND